jgi:ribulose 1,5-bisphosphate carboxylase large subunit-like protein
MENEVNIFRPELNKEDYVIVTYFLKSQTTLRDASWNLAIGQSVGNPNVRNQWETNELFENHSCMVIANEEDLQSNEGLVKIGFPVININFKTDGISHLLVNIMGGQLDIDNVLKCQVLNIEFPKHIEDIFLGPKFGIDGIRKFTGVYDKPIFGAIVKPKTGISAQTLLEMVKELVEGGVNFIKEDEILSDPSFCTIEERVPLIMDYLKDKNVIYSVSIHADYPYIIDRVKRIYELGGNSVHVNFWCGLGVYRAIRELDLPMFIHFQKSGDKILTNKNHDFHIDWKVICKLAGMMGVDFIHAGMIGGYYKWDEQETLDAVKILNDHNVMPALSCGFQPGLTEWVTSKVGIDYMANVGGAIHGHPGGTIAGAKAMRQSIDSEFGPEYDQAIQKWGKR